MSPGPMTSKTAPFGSWLAITIGGGEASTVAATAKQTSMAGKRFKKRASSEWLNAALAAPRLPVTVSGAPRHLQEGDACSGR